MKEALSNQRGSSTLNTALTAGGFVLLVNIAFEAPGVFADEKAKGMCLQAFTDNAEAIQAEMGGDTYEFEETFNNRKCTLRLDESGEPEILISRLGPANG